MKKLYYLKEINYRLLYSFITFLLNFCVAYNYKQSLIYQLLPKGLHHIVSTSLTEIFIIYLQISFLIAFTLTLLSFLLQSFFFFKPGLYKHESNFIIINITKVIFLYSMFYCFVFPFILQISWNLFSIYSESFSPVSLSFELKLDQYLNYACNLALGLNFGLLIFIVFLFYLNPKKQRKIFYLYATLCVIITSPPDIYSQVLIYFTLVFIYEFRTFTYTIYNQYFDLIRQPAKGA